MQVEESEGIFSVLSEPEKRQALNFLPSVVKRYNSSIIQDASRISESCKTGKAEELGNVIQTVYSWKNKYQNWRRNWKSTVCDVWWRTVSFSRTRLWEQWWRQATAYYIHIVWLKIPAMRKSNYKICNVFLKTEEKELFNLFPFVYWGKH